MVSSQLQFRQAPVSGSKGAETDVRGIDWHTILSLCFHAFLGLLLARFITLSTAHALLTITVGLLLAVRSRKQPERVAYIAAYIVGAEVLWRMTDAQIFWEFGKYASSGVLLLFLVLHRRDKLKGMPFLYFALLMPSILLTVIGVADFSEFRQSLSFYLSGPLALAAAWCFFRDLRLSATQMHRVFLALLCPTVSMATIALFGIVTSDHMDFTNESNFAASGGFGPNQVSGALALGMVAALLWLLTSKGGWINKLVLFAVLVFLATQSALTFSRGGLYNAAGASVVALYFLLRDQRTRGGAILAVGAILLVGVFIVLPRLEQFTGGAISTRFTNLDLAHRDEIINADFVLWSENPVLGVGPGMAAVHRRMPHTEITRLLAEHGILGLIAIIVLTLSAAQAIRHARNNSGKAVAGSMVTFSLLFMLDKAMRLAAPSFAFGLAFATLITNDAGQPKPKAELNAGLVRRRMQGTRRRPLVSTPNPTASVKPQSQIAEAAIKLS